MFQIPFRQDKYGKNFYFEKDGEITVIPYKTGTYEYSSFVISVAEDDPENALKINISIMAKEKQEVERFGFRLGIDTYMEKYPEWNYKFFPTALRCEKNGFWSCFMSPLGKCISVCSPSKIVSWKNEYNQSYGETGHRIYTSSVEFINTYKQPERHIKSPQYIDQIPLTFELYYSDIISEEEMYSFVKKYCGISIPSVNKFTLEKNEPLFINNKKYENLLSEGVNTIADGNSAELSIFVRKSWFYYLDCARKSAEKCQQKPGTHTESWYGYFSLVAYAKEIGDDGYKRNLCNKFDEFFSILTKGRDNRKKFKKKALPHRLQNVSCMLSLLADFYELTQNMKYLMWGENLASWLMKLQSKLDGSYRNHGTHYTCVIYPAKSLLEFALAEKEAGLEEKYKVHFDSAYKAIQNLYELKDNIQTEGEMTFEDGMISCESLQLGYLATLLSDEKDKAKFTQCAKEILEKHRCLEQQILPDCRVRGCTLRYWEARYDVNFFSNMLNSPHGWTSWKTYATYYLYLLTGELNYLKDTMDTVGACMQCVDETGELYWGYAADPCIVGMNLKKGCAIGNICYEKTVVGEQYLPMISDWFTHDKHLLQSQYIQGFSNVKKENKYYGGSCDNDVHEHFKCLHETVFGKAFIHECEDKSFVTYNCRENDAKFETNDKFVKKTVVYLQSPREINFNNKQYAAQKGLNIIDL